jgi:hypothetical protein
MFIGAPGGGDPDEIVAASIDDTCAALASYLRERLGG